MISATATQMPDMIKSMQSQSMQQPAERGTDPVQDVPAMEAASTNRDTARQAAMHVVEISQPTKNMETYVQASGHGDSAPSAKASPADIYQNVMQYSRRVDMVNVMEQQAAKTPGENRVSIMV